jgi:hypothetical protein
VEIDNINSIDFHLAEARKPCMEPKFLARPNSALPEVIRVCAGPVRYPVPCLGRHPSTMGGLAWPINQRPARSDPLPRGVIKHSPEPAPPSPHSQTLAYFLRLCLFTFGSPLTFLALLLCLHRCRPPHSCSRLLRSSEVSCYIRF